MASQQPEDIEASELIVEFRGNLSKDDLSRVLDQLQVDGGVNRFRIEIGADHAVYTSLANADEHPVEAGREPAESTDEAAAEPKRPENESADTETGEEEVPRLQPEGDPFRVARGLADQVTWLTTDELREVLSDDADVNLSNLGTILWTLADRGLIDKRPYEEDRRKSEYRITDTGTRTIEEAADRRASKEEKAQQEEGHAEQEDQHTEGANA